ncbi:hypothetical protein [Nonlabens antarcticus]|uniref:hypothetical protein n=1 Tax=Nonlabens antarcticus TaxID=392714 RepID=UPI0018912D2E|nr:hypothetical protein [Nonlabens antarcticus]
MKNFIFLILLVLVASCSDVSQDTPINASQGDVGPLDPSLFANETEEEASYWSIENLVESLENDTMDQDYPELSMKDDTMISGEGTVRRVVKIIAGDTPNELVVSYDGNKPFQLMYGSRGKWRTKHSIYIGSPVEALNKVNGKPIKFGGFGWEYSGLVRFEGGAIDASSYDMFIAPDKKNVSEDAAFEFLGSDFYRSDAPDVEKLHLYVSSITYKF